MLAHMLGIAYTRATSGPIRIPGIALLAKSKDSARGASPYFRTFAEAGLRTTLPIPTIKGKERAIDEKGSTNSPISYSCDGSTIISRKQSRYLIRKGFPSASTLGLGGHHARQFRLFHCTARRNAVPLLPVSLMFFKSTSILAVITTISRILISFFPLGTIAAFRSVRGVRWLSKDAQTPTVGPEAQEFWQMWCADERAIKPTRDDAKLLLASELRPDGAIPLSDGRRAWIHPYHPLAHPKWEKYSDPKVLREDPDGDFGGIRDRAKDGMLIKRTFFLPPLPSSSISYFDRLDPTVQAEVNELRRYWVSLHSFKDQLFWARLAVFTLLLLPTLLLAGVYVCALERVPYTGRWRIILLTAEEEDQISNSLAGTNWFKSVINLLTTPQAPAPPVVPLSDWRWRWVEGVLRRLENGVIVAAAAHEAGMEDAWAGIGDIRPPISKYPLRPRPRVATRLHSALPGGDSQSGREHLELGPPFSLMLMEKDEKNAFSYGFGGKGAGGVVVFTGLLDDILAQDVDVEEAPKIMASKKSGILGGLFSSSTPPQQPRRPPQPTEDQTLHLASVLAHEMGHLLLSHHLETLSQQQVLWPSLLGLSMDMVRAFIWPFTVFLGPAVNDALANVGRTTTEELVDRYGEIGFQWKHEYEADKVGLRILARAGFDPKIALTHFAKSITDLHEIQPLDKDASESWTGSLFKLWTRATHPSSESRLSELDKELATWVKVER